VIVDIRFLQIQTPEKETILNTIFVYFYITANDNREEQIIDSEVILTVSITVSFTVSFAVQKKL
jgi:hypothetical protein